MLDTIDICSFLLLESKYGTDLEHYDKRKSKYFLKKCIKSNTKRLHLMNNIQKIILKSIFIQNKTEEQFKKLQEIKQIFDEYLEYMNRLSKSLEIAVTSKPQNNKWNTYLRLEIIGMRKEVNVNELIDKFSDMANRNTLLARGGVSQQDLLMQIIGTIVVVAMEDEAE